MFTASAPPSSTTVAASSASSSSRAPGAAAPVPAAGSPAPAAGSVSAFSAHASASSVVAPPSSFAFASPSAPLNPFSSFSSSLSAALPASAAVAASADPPLFSCGSFGAGSSSSALSAHRSPHRHAATSARLKPKHKAAMVFGTDAGQQEQNMIFKTVEGAAMEAAAVPVAAESAVSAHAAAPAASSTSCIVPTVESSAPASVPSSGTARAKVKVLRSLNSRRSTDVASRKVASNSSASSAAPPSASPAMYTPLNMAHTDAWIRERALWDSQDEIFDDESSTEQEILAMLLASNISLVLADLIVQYAEPPCVSLLSDDLGNSPILPSTAVLVACSLDVRVSPDTDLECMAREQTAAAVAAAAAATSVPQKLKGDVETMPTPAKISCIRQLSPNNGQFAVSLEGWRSLALLLLNASASASSVASSASAQSVHVFSARLSRMTSAWRVGEPLVHVAGSTAGRWLRFTAEWHSAADRMGIRFRRSALFWRLSRTPRDWAELHRREDEAARDSVI